MRSDTSNSMRLTGARADPNAPRGRGGRMPKENDGADAALTLHIADECVLVTNENPLVILSTP